VLPASRRPLLRIAALVGAMIATVGLAACEKPAPGATVFSGTTSAHREAVCWAPEANEAFVEADCSISLQSSEEFNQRLLDKVAIVATTPGETVGISVDPAVAESGWLVSINGRALTREPISEEYFRFTMPPQPLRKGDAQLVIQALTDDGEAIRGSWIFGLTETE
jgi:methionine-rich copper-binding protein CopC